MLCPPRDPKDWDDWARWVSAPVLGDLQERTPWRALAKAFTYRVYNSLITAALVYFATGSFQTMLGVGLAELGIKFVLYYLHERVWQKMGEEAE